MLSPPHNCRHTGEHDAKIRATAEGSGAGHVSFGAAVVILLLLTLGKFSCSSLFGGL